MKKLSDSIFEALEQDQELHAMLNNYLNEINLEIENRHNSQKNTGAATQDRFLKLKREFRQKNASSDVLSNGMRG
jgi:hypothetical protein